MTLRQPREEFRHLSVEQSEVAERVCAFIRAVHPYKPAQHVHARTGIKPRTVEKWLERTSAPMSAHFVVLFLAYGPEFLCAVAETPPDWLTQASEAARDQSIEAKIEKLRASLGQVRS